MRPLRRHNRLSASVHIWTELPRVRHNQHPGHGGHNRLSASVHKKAVRKTHCIIICAVGAYSCLTPGFSLGWRIPQRQCLVKAPHHGPSGSTEKIADPRGFCKRNLKFCAHLRINSTRPDGARVLWGALDPRFRSAPHSFTRG